MLLNKNWIRNQFALKYTLLSKGNSSMIDFCASDYFKWVYLAYLAHDFISQLKSQKVQISY